MFVTPSVAVVILNWNGRRFLEQFLPSVCASTYPNLEIVLADNASTDDSIAFVEQHYSAVRVIRNVRNDGYAGGYNAALMHVEATYYVLLNSDVEVTPGWIEPVIGLMERDASIGACQPKLLAYNERDTFEYAGAAGGWMDVLGYPFARGRVFEHCEKDQGQYDVAEPVFWASGAALFIRSDVFHEVGGFDTYFFAHQEEIDLCWRLHAAGYSVYSCPASVVYHVGGGTLPKGNEKKVMLNFRNNLLLLLKNMPFGYLLWVFPLRYALDVVAALRELLGGNVSYWRAIGSAHLQVWVWLLRWRKPGVFPVRRKIPAEGLFRGCIVGRYFLRKQYTFTKILGI